MVGGSIGDARMHVSSVTSAPKSSTGWRTPFSSACAFIARLDVTRNLTRGSACRPRTSGASCPNSAAEKCGLPRITMSSSRPSAVVNSLRAARRSPTLTVTSISGARPRNAAASVGASGVTPTMWNNATRPEDAAAAANALSWSSVG